MSAPPGSRRRRLLALLTAVALPPLAVVLYAFPPTAASYYPRCLLHSATGLHCPGCGATRCAHALLHGDLAQAAGYNLLLLATLPYLLWSGARYFWYGLRGEAVPRRYLPAWVLRVIFVVVVGFGVVRNLPYYPATLLAPRVLEPAPAASAPLPGRG